MIKKNTKRTNIDEKTIVSMCLKHNEHLHIMKAICHYPFHFIQQKSKDGLYVFLLHGFGKFLVKPGTKNFMLKRDEQNKRDPQWVEKPYMERRRNRKTRLGKIKGLPRLPTNEHIPRGNEDV